MAAYGEWMKARAIRARRGQSNLIKLRGVRRRAGEKDPAFLDNRREEGDNGQFEGGVTKATAGNVDHASQDTLRQQLQGSTRISKYGMEKCYRVD